MKNTKAFSVALPAEGSEAEQREAAPAGVGAERPDPEVVAKAKRRIFTGEYKQRILAEADQAVPSSGVSALCSSRGPVFLSPGDVAPRALCRNSARSDATEARTQVQAEPARRREPETASRQRAPP